MNLKTLLLIFILVPVVEFCIFMLLAKVISLWVTLSVIILTGIIGAYLSKKQGALAMRNFRTALGSGKMPHVEATDGILILIAGAVLLTPGFLTDAVGFALLLPPTRKVLRSVLSEKLKKHIHVATPNFGAQIDPQNAGSGMKQANGRVVEES